eukprot:TRINITY_DN928_c0_g1_i1.p1 TRINITY_DN928_c0_g1~~TRINITY_DN928_c0_g1_i1.p1  ORF type:complete len:174 (+),score=25.01 TRINITY_DN928_c0_g1_i1:63-524(+)
MLSDLVSRYIKLAPGLFFAMLSKVEAGFKGTPQEPGSGCDAPKFEVEYRFVDWTKKARYIHNQTRAWYGDRDSPQGSVATVDGSKIVLLRTKLLVRGKEEETTLTADDVKPGTVMAKEKTESGETLTVKCGDHPLLVLEWKAYDPKTEKEYVA